MQGSEDDHRHMLHALRLGARALGTCAPNPAVGCVIVSDTDHVVGRGWTSQGGRPHAETMALVQAGAAAKGATAYVTLEPCAHHGQTPPCADALISAGIARVVAAIADPDPRVSGRGLARLAEAGIAVSRGILEAEARTAHAGFFKRIAEGRPLVALKIAQSADGYVADANGNSKWITGEAARRHGHMLRAQYDAILVGIGTALADDPALSCRLPGLGHRSPIRVVLDSALRLPPTSQLAIAAQTTKTIVFTSRRDGGEALVALGVEIARIAAGHDGRPDLGNILSTLAERGITRLLVEGGPTIHAGFLRQNLADILHIYRALLLLGAGAISAIAASHPFPLGNAPRLSLLERVSLGPDVLESFARTV